MQAWQADAQNSGHSGRAWSAPSQPPGHWDSQQAQPSQVGDASHILAWSPVHQAEQVQQSDAVPSAVQRRAAQYAGDEGLARPPTRPPSDWQSRQAQSHGDEVVVPHGPQSSDRYEYSNCASSDWSTKHMIVHTEPQIN